MPSDTSFCGWSHGVNAYSLQMATICSLDNYWNFKCTFDFTGRVESYKNFSIRKTVVLSSQTEQKLKCIRGVEGTIDK